ASDATLNVRPARSSLAATSTVSVRSVVVHDHRPPNRPVPTAHPNTASGSVHALISATSTRSPKLNRDPSRTHELRRPSALAARAGEGAEARCAAPASAGNLNSILSTTARGSPTGGYRQRMTAALAAAAKTPAGSER